MDFDKMLSERTGEAEKIISEYMPEPGRFNGRLVEAMNYSLTAGVSSGLWAERERLLSPLWQLWRCFIIIRLSMTTFRQLITMITGGEGLQRTDVLMSRLQYWQETDFYTRLMRLL